MVGLNLTNTNNNNTIKTPSNDPFTLPPPSPSTLVAHFPDIFTTHFSLPLSSFNDFTEDWIEQQFDTISTDMSDLKNVDFGVQENLKVEDTQLGLGGSDNNRGLGEDVEVEGEERGVGDVKMEEKVGGGLGGLVEKEMAKVSLVEGGGDLMVGDVKGKDGREEVVVTKVDDGDGGSESESDSDESSVAALSSDTSSEEKIGEGEEGEIVDLELDVDSDEEGCGKGPIKSKNEIEDLPPVPPVDATLKPHHCTLPVGVVLSMMGTKVVVEGLEKHNPLNEGSILWITDSRSPLGIVDEIFGPVKNPYYIVRYNSEEEVPSGVREGTPVSFVQEFANHVLNEKSLYNKGYDASGDNDEEISDELEFSDDEKEAEYKKTLKMAKKGTNGKKRGNLEFGDKEKARVHQLSRQKGGFSRNIQHSEPKNTGANRFQSPADLNKVGSGNTASSNVSLSANTPQQFGPSNLIRPNGVPFQQQQGILSPNSCSMNGIPFSQGAQPNFANGMQYQPQFGGGFPYGLSNFSQGSPVGWPGLVGHAAFNPAQFGMCLQSVNGPNQVQFGMGLQNPNFLNQMQPGIGLQGQFNQNQAQYGVGLQSQVNQNQAQLGMNIQGQSQMQFGMGFQGQSCQSPAQLGMNTHGMNLAQLGMGLNGQSQVGMVPNGQNQVVMGVHGQSGHNQAQSGMGIQGQNCQNPTQFGMNTHGMNQVQFGMGLNGQNQVGMGPSGHNQIQSGMGVRGQNCQNPTQFGMNTHGINQVQLGIGQNVQNQVGMGVHGQSGHNQAQPGIQRLDEKQARNGEQESIPNSEQSNGAQQSMTNQRNIPDSQQLNDGPASGRGNRPFPRGGGRFSRGGRRGGRR